MADTKPVVNHSMDLGAFVIEDCQGYEGLAEGQIMDRTKANLCQFYKQLFELKKQQKLDMGGEDGEILEYTRSAYAVTLPHSKIVLPRENPPPKEKPMTKWEKFRLEKGIATKEKRSRMVFDELTNDWVPRYGAGSIKKVQDKYNWLMEEKPKHVEAGMDPFTYKKNEKKLE